MGQEFKAEECPGHRLKTLVSGHMSQWQVLETDSLLLHVGCLLQRMWNDREVSAMCFL